MSFRDRDMKIDDVINHIRNHEYMSGVERDKARVRSTGEVFTPTELVLKYIDQCEKQNPDAFTNPDENFCDNSCGDGQFLGEILIRKMERGIQFESALRSIHGVDYQESNVELCKQRLLCGHTELRHIVDMNIVCADSTLYHYRFDGTPEGYLTREELIEKVAELEAIKKIDKADRRELRKLKSFKKGKEREQDRANKEKARADLAEAQLKQAKQYIRKLKKSHKTEMSELKKSHREELRADMKAMTERVRELEEQLQEQAIKKEIISGNGIEIVE